MTSADAPLRNPNHPKKGAAIKVDPITDLKAIKRIKKLLSDHPRDLCLFTLGINTAYRANEIVSITIGQVAHLKAGDCLSIKQCKNKKYRPTLLNEAVIKTLGPWLAVHPNPGPASPLFISAKTAQALKSVTLTEMVKRWCAEAGLRGNYGSHTLRKTWGYHQRKTYGKPTALLTQAYGHSHEGQTLDYLSIRPEEIDDLYVGAL